jgi:copper transport protein
MFRRSGHRFADKNMRQSTNPCAMRGHVILAAMIAALLALASIAPARAHATMVASDPPDGAVIPAPPAQLVLSFNEPVAPLVLRLTRPDSSVAVLDATARDASITVPLPMLGQGTHVLSWRAVSLDGHPVGGSVVFSIGAPSAGPDFTLDRADPPVALWLCKLVLYLGLFVGVGASFFRAWVAPGQDGATPAIFMALGLLAAPIAVGLQGADALGVPPQGLARAAVWRAGLETSFGPTAIVAAFALLAGLFALRTSARTVTRGLSLFGLLAIGLALALSGHASAAAPQWLTRPAVFVHAVTVAFWVGSLVPLAAALRADTAVLAAFSRAIPWAIGPLVVAGAVLAVIQVEQPELLLSTAYGRLLCAKLLLVALLFMLAAWNRYRLTPAITAGRDDARQRLRRTIMFEFAIVAIILGLVAAWRFTPPPRALAIAAAQPAFVHIHSAEAMAEVTLQPGQAGLVRAEVIIMTGDFGGLDAKEVALTFENAAAGIESISRPAVKGADAIWRIEKFPIPRGGRWDVRVDILVNDFEKLRLDGQIDIRAR